MIEAALQARARREAARTRERTAASAPGSAENPAAPVSRASPGAACIPGLRPSLRLHLRALPGALSRPVPRCALLLLLPLALSLPAGAQTGATVTTPSTGAAAAPVAPSSAAAGIKAPPMPGTAAAAMEQKSQPGASAPPASASPTANPAAPTPVPAVANGAASPSAGTGNSSSASTAGTAGSFTGPSTAPASGTGAAAPATTATPAQGTAAATSAAVQSANGRQAVNPPAAGPSQAGSTLQVLFGLVAVLGLMAACAWLLKRANITKGGSAGAIRVVGGVSVGNRERVMVVEVAGHWIVVGVAAGSVNALATLPRPEAGGNAGAGGAFPERAPNGDTAGHANFSSWLKQKIDQRNARS